MTQMWNIPLSKLREWKTKLEQEPSVPGDAISFVKDQIDDILLRAREFNKVQEKVSESGLTFADIEVGKEYRLKDSPSVKENVRGATFQITDKKRTRVKGILKTCPTSNYKVGTIFNLHPENLEEI